MPLPLILIGAAVAVGATGIGFGVKSKIDFDEAEDINQDAKSLYDRATRSLEERRDEVQSQLVNLGKEKVTLMRDKLPLFVDTFRQIKNVDYAGLEVPKEITPDLEAEFLALEEYTVEMSETVGGAAGALGTGALAGVAAYGSVGLLGTASTGTAISGLVGIAAKNATLAWLGGGSLATGGMGIAGGTAVLGGIVAAPVLLVGGLLLASKAASAKEDARSNMAKARAAAETMKTAESAARDIGRMAEQALRVLLELHEHMDRDLPVFQHVVAGNQDYLTYNHRDKELVARTVSVAITAKNVAETPLLEEDGAVTEAIGKKLRKARQFLEQLKNK